MKLNKACLLKSTKTGLEELGYRELPDTITPAQGLFIKIIQEQYYLTLGFTISRYYDNLFTASFYISRTTTWGLVGLDIPRQIYKRVGSFLTLEERQQLLKGEYAEQSKGDAWWCSENEGAVTDFIDVVRMAEPRFLNQPSLLLDIDNSQFFKEFAELVKETTKAVKIVEKGDDVGYQFIPQKIIDGIPVAWFKAAEKVIQANNLILNVNTVKRLGADAYRQHLLSKT
ncbi:hypothetical protein [Mucilaginibacter sp. PAMB04168]|uniref:hypothetical protein n=1 Tax=Mucilaginibacter sp. PAMB04168 TaxID=3138567 RepID=UPI0031F6CE14